MRNIDERCSGKGEEEIIEEDRTLNVFNKTKSSKSK